MLKFLENIKKKLKIISIIFLIVTILGVLLYFTISSFKLIVDELKIYLWYFLEIINYPILSFSNTKISTLNIIIFLLVVYLGFVLWFYYKKFIYRIRKKNKLSHSTTTILANIWYYAIITIILLSSLKIVGIDLSNIAIIAWALSVWIWFWLQNIVSNFVSGIILMFEKSIKVGDYVEISNNIRGTVIDIKMRSITIKTNDNIDIVIPNQKFIENDIINRTLNDKKVRFRIPFWVAYWTPVKLVEKVIKKALEESNISYLKSGEYKPLVIMQWMNSSSVDFWLYVWIKWDDITRPNRTKSIFLKMIYTALNENDITIPFPQTDLHIKDSVPLEIKLVEK